MSESRKGEAITQESLKEAMKSQFQRTLTEEEASAMIQVLPFLGEPVSSAPGSATKMAFFHKLSILIRKSLQMSTRSAFRSSTRWPGACTMGYTKPSETTWRSHTGLLQLESE
mmetsp:Transcript_36845/g.57624  ORF Transcript_36845/g.57624 Transcript_36845/m.57624 type:complete len:113 (+) Transcript_36845:2016-2354(+)